MHKLILATVCVLLTSSVALAERLFAEITGVDAAKGTINYKITFGKDKKGTEVNNAQVIKDCVIREGFYRLGKPARTEEKDEIVNGLKNFVFEKASPDNPLRVNIYTADADDAEKGIKKGDVIKILVNPVK